MPKGTGWEGMSLFQYLHLLTFNLPADLEVLFLCGKARTETLNLPEVKLSLFWPLIRARATFFLLRTVGILSTAGVLESVMSNKGQSTPFPACLLRTPKLCRAARHSEEVDISLIGKSVI